MVLFFCVFFFFFSSRRRHTRCSRDWSSDVCSSDLTFAAYRIGFAVSRPSRRRNRTASSPSPASRAPRPAFSSSTTRSSRTSSACASLSPAELVLLERRSEEHTSELQSRLHLVCRLL